MKRLVKFANGKFGIRYGWLCHEFQDFHHPGFRWSINSQFMPDCMTDEETARRFFDTPLYTVIN